MDLEPIKFFDVVRPTKNGKYNTNRGELEYNVEIGHFLDDDRFPIYSDDKILWWDDISPQFTQGAKNRLEWIKKRVELSDLQEDIVGFMLNQQEQIIISLTNKLENKW